MVSRYASQAGQQEVPVATLRKAIGGDQIFYVPIVPGASLFAGPLPHLPVGTLTRRQVLSHQAAAAPPCARPLRHLPGGTLPRRQLFSNEPTPLDLHVKKPLAVPLRGHYLAV